MKKQSSFQAHTLSKNEMHRLKGGGYRVTYRALDGSLGTRHFSSIAGIVVGGELPGSPGFIVIETVDGA